MSAAPTGGGPRSYTNMRPTSLDFINRPNPVEPNTGTERHPLHDAHRLRRAAKQDPLRHVLNPAPVIPDEPATKRQRIGDGPLLDLPRLPVRTPIKKPRLPPTLSGLHQPPPDARLLPSINVEKPRAKSPAKVDRSDEQPTSQPTPAKDSTTKDEQGSNARTKASRQKSEASSQETQVDTAISVRPKQTRGKRRKWSDEETACLLKGVAKYGIGSWTKILRDPDLSFERRTRNDLKDRFRVCCPDQYKLGTHPNGTQEVPTDIKLNEEPVGVPGKKKRGVKPERKSAAELQQMGFAEPFAEASHRQKQDFTEAEDRALLRGFRAHGKQWAEIRDDHALRLSHRSAPDLRDRFRSRFKAEYTTSASRADNGEVEATSVESTVILLPAVNAEIEGEAEVVVQTGADHTPRPAMEIPPNDKIVSNETSSSASKMQQPSLFQFDDVFFGAPFDEDTANDEPIVLDRQILDYAKVRAHDERQDRLPGSHPLLQLPFAATGSFSTALPSLATITAIGGVDDSGQLELPSLLQWFGTSETDGRIAGHSSFLNLDELLS